MHTCYGDFIAHTPHGDFTFKPSLKNIYKIGSPAEIINIFSKVHMISFIEWLKDSDNKSEVIANNFLKLSKNVALDAALKVLRACCDDDISKFVGSWELIGTKITGRSGDEKDYDKILTLAKHLLLHGVIGDTETKSTHKSAKKVREFKATDYVTMARRHLSMDREEAWSLTMTELVMEMEALTPTESNDNGAPSDDQYDEVMAMMAGLNKGNDNG